MPILSTDVGRAACDDVRAIPTEPVVDVPVQAYPTARVVVTGAAGFIGGHLLRALSTLGTEVVGVDERQVSAVAESPRIVLHRADVVTADLVRLFAEADTVFHLAGQPGVRPSWGVEFDRYLRTNVLGTQRVVQACERAGVRRLVVASSSSVYGAWRGRASLESDPVQPQSPYGVTKLAAEQLCLAHALRRGATTTVVALRYFTVYGPGQRPDMLIARLLRGSRTGQPTPIFGNGWQSRDFTYVDDVVRATLGAGTCPARAEVINVAGGRPSNLAEVISTIEELAGRPVPTVSAGDQHGDVACTQGDLSRARQLLGYAPQVSLRDGLSRHLAWESAQALVPFPSEPAATPVPGAMANGGGQ